LEEIYVKTTDNTILITGGATGIGPALAEAFLQAGNRVIICGRRKEKLLHAKNKLPDLHTHQCDIADTEQLKKLFEWTTRNFPDVNILVNNAGIQREIDFRKGIRELLDGENEIDINFQALVYLSAWFIPHLIKQKEAAILNISSGLGFMPLSIMPLYCATKAAVHSFSWSLRHQLKDTPVKVFEIVPPTVDTELDKGARDRRGQTDRGIQPAIVAKTTLQAMKNDEFELAVGQAEFLRTASRNEPEEVFRKMNARW
jgi:uncharacterized oxidoreductase